MPDIPICIHNLGPSIVSKPEQEQVVIDALTAQDRLSDEAQGSSQGGAAMARTDDERAVSDAVGVESRRCVRAA
jgi:hypothetical protein